MGFSDVSVFIKMSMALGIVAFLFDLIGFASPYWLTESDEKRGVKVSYFLWQYCFSRNGNSTCQSIPPRILQLSFQTSRAFNILGFLAGGVAVVLIILYIFCLNDKKPVRRAGMIASFVAAGLIMVGVIIIGTSIALQNTSIGWAMMLAIIGAVLYLITGVLMVVSDTQTSPVCDEPFSSQLALQE